MRFARITLTFVFSIAAFVAGYTQTPTRHVFTVHDWAVLRSASPVAVSADGVTILYRVVHGSESGIGGHEYWSAHPDGSGAAKLELPDEFSPSGFMPGGGALYGA